MSLYEIIKSIQAAKGSLAKQALLNENSGNELFKAYMKAVSDPALNYFQSKPPVVSSQPGNCEFVQTHIDYMVEGIAGRKVTGGAAIKSLAAHLSTLNAEGRELMSYIIKRSIGGSVGETMVLKAWPGLFFCPPYLRCAGMSPKVKEEYAAMPYFFVQQKLDGQFAYLRIESNGKASLFTRNGSFYPSWLADKMAEGCPRGTVLMGELLVFQGGVVLDRKTGNGVLNSALQTGEAPSDEFVVKLIAWDIVTIGEFMAARSDTPYRLRLETFEDFADKTLYVSVVEHHNVKSLEEAFEINRGYLLKGCEGTVIKNPEGIWRNSSSGTRDAVKLKIAFQAEYVVTGSYEGEGKAKGMLGGFNVTSSDGLISCNVGSGFSDKQRKDFWNEDVSGWIVTLDANDVITKEGCSTESLFLPIFIERRLDKTEADSRGRVLEQLQAAKEGI